MNDLIKQYLKEHLTIKIKEERYGFNGECIVFELLVDGEVISSDSIDIKRDEG